MCYPLLLLVNSLTLVCCLGCFHPLLSLKSATAFSKWTDFCWQTLFWHIFWKNALTLFKNSTIHSFTFTFHYVHDCFSAMICFRGFVLMRLTLEKHVHMTHLNGENREHEGQTPLSFSPSFSALLFQNLFCLNNQPQPENDWL